MREFELIIDEALRNGLTPFDVTPFNSQVLYGCLGFRCGKATLELYEQLRNPLPVTIDMLYSWPFPQFIVGERYNLLIVRDSVTNLEDIVYLISDDMTTVTYIFSVDELTFGKGTLMEVADFGEYAFMTNGVIMIYWDVTLSVWDKIVASATIPMMRTVCNFKGQAVGGNVVSSWHDCDETYYIWSKIGGMDFTPDRRNEAGYKRCPYGGTIYHVRRLGGNVVGYSSKGLTLLNPVSQPAATFGFTELSNMGLINQGAMNGDYERHIYVGEDYRLREVTPQGVKELGYRRYIERLAGEDIVVSYDKSKKDFYVGNSTKTYLLSLNGLTEIPQHPSAMWRIENETFMLPDTVDDYESLIVSEAFDMGYRGQKTVFSLESDIVASDNPQVAVDYSLAIPNLFNTSVYRPLNNQGISSMIIGGNAFRFRLKFDSVFDRISYIKARYKMTDLRGIRGVYAPPPRGQVG